MNKKYVKGYWQKLVDMYDAYIKQTSILSKFAEKYDGKIINKRFVDALKSEGFMGGVSIENIGSQYVFVLSSNVDSRYPTSDHSCNYLHDSWRLTSWSFSASGNNKYCYIDCNRRLNYSMLVKTIDEEVQSLRKNLEKYKYGIDHFDELFGAVMEVNKAVADLNKKLEGTVFHLSTKCLEISQFEYNDYQLLYR